MTQPSVRPHDSVEHAVRHAAEVDVGLRIVERLVRLEVARMRAAGVPAAQDSYRGLYLSEEEIDALLSAPSDDGHAARTDEFEAVREASRAQAQLSALTADAKGPLGRLIRLADLTPFEVGCLLLCLALDADLRFERLFAYVQDDVTKRSPRVELALRLLAEPAGRREARRAFSAEAPLRRLHLLTLHGEPGQPPAPLLARTLALDPRIAQFLLGQPGLDEALRPHAELFSNFKIQTPLACPPGQANSRSQSATSDSEHPASRIRLPMPDDLRQRLSALMALPPTALDDPIVHLTGRDVVTFRAVAQGLAHASGLGLLTVNFPLLASSLGVDVAFTLAAREAALQSAALLLTGLQLLKPDQASLLRDMLERLRLAPLTLLSSDGAFPWAGLMIGLPDPDLAARLALWRQALGSEALALDPQALDSLAGKFRLGAEAISAAARAARGSARWRNPAAPGVVLDDLYAAARAQSTPILSHLAHKVTPHYTWDDIVLPPDALEQLREMCAYVEHRHVVYERWGFERKLALGKGLMALFAGPSGTGKTMAADILAGALGLDLYKIDLSGVVSKYIGETEKNLDRIFTEARASNAILFFDEADALFGKRSEVRDSHDRYANIETAYLLQKMEEYDGVVILATNLKMNLDEAFLRRMHFAVDFPMPDEADRRRIWETTLPAELPLADDVDLAFLARKFKLSGGNIRNVVLSAAFLAAAAPAQSGPAESGRASRASGQVVSMQHLIRATRREFHKLGRMITPADFEGYYEWVESP